MSYCDFAAGWGGGMVGLLVGHPLDTIKVNQQTRGIGIRTCIQEVYKQGYRGFFRGMGFPLVAQGAMNAAFFGVYGHTLDILTMMEKRKALRKENIQNFYQTREELESTGKALMTNDNIYRPNSEIESSYYFNVGAAGCVAGLAYLSIACPVEVVKIKLQTQMTEPKFRGPIALIKHILSTQGFRGLYQGLTTMIWRDSPSFGVYMVIYEFGANKVKKWSAEKNEPPSSLGLFVSGGIAGTVCWWTILPLDVIKSYIQSQDPKSSNYKGAIESTKYIFRNQGLKGFFRGFWSLSFRAFPVNGATLLTYEWFNFICRYINGSRDNFGDKSKNI